MKVALLAATLVLLTSNALAEGWICQADMATGFIFNGTMWESAEFSVVDSEYLIRRPNPDDAEEALYDWIVVTIGEQDSHYQCQDDPGDGLLECAGRLWGEFNLDMTRLRFVLTYSMGYLTGLNENADTPLMEIGRCSPN